jgi:hypothetical protein
MKDQNNDGSQQKRWICYLDIALLLSWKKAFIVCALFILTTIFHRVIYASFIDSLGQFGMTDAGIGLIPGTLFVLGAIIIPLYLLLALAYTIVRTMPVYKYLTLSWRTLYLIPTFIVGVVLHNAIYALFYDHFIRVGGDEAIFFIAALLVIPAYFVVSVVYTLVIKFSRSV